MRVRLLPDERWSQLVDTTLDLLELVPPYDLVIDDIATSACVSRGLVYRYFSGIDDLVGHAQRRFFNSLQTELEQSGDAAREPLDQLRAVVSTTVHFAAAHRGTFCNLVDGGVPNRADEGPVAAAILRLTSGFRPTIDAVLAAKASAALIETGIASWLRDERIDADAVIDLLFTLAARGLHDRAAVHAKSRPHREGTLASIRSSPCPDPITPLRRRGSSAVSQDGLGRTPMTMKENS